MNEGEDRISRRAALTGVAAVALEGVLPVQAAENENAQITGEIIRRDELTPGEEGNKIVFGVVEVGEDNKAAENGYNLGFVLNKDAVLTIYKGDNVDTVVITQPSGREKNPPAIKITTVEFYRPPNTI